MIDENKLFSFINIILFNFLISHTKTYRIVILNDHIQEYIVL